MLQILGIGAAYGSTLIDNKLLSDIGLGGSPEEILQQSQVSTRRSCLPLRYLQINGNSDIRLGQIAALTSPAQLGVEAALLAVSRAGIQLEDLQLVVADSGTPFQTTPCEAQRITGELGLRIPAYDITGGSGALALHLQNILQWKASRTPKYILCVSTNLPTQATNYQASGPSFFVGDCAVAVVVSKEAAGKLQVEQASFQLETTHQKLFQFFTDSPISVDFPRLEPLASRYLKQSLEKELSNSQIAKEQTKLVSSYIDPRVSRKIWESSGISEQNHWTNVPTVGYAFGSSLLSVLSDRWDEILPNERFIAPFVGTGISHGRVTLRS